jgi:protein transport protein SEC31
MKVGHIDKNATVAWSKSAPLLALGSLAGTMSESFDTSGTLEIYDLSRGPENVEHKATVETPEKFFKLIWSQTAGKQPLGLIAGGMESGVINLWNPSLTLQYDSFFLSVFILYFYISCHIIILFVMLSLLY